jgi:threonine/homoserine/homoserine lactone efflux protein
LLTPLVDSLAGILGRGLLLGFSIAAPVGPIGLLCIQRTLRFGRAAGLATGLGAATADACYGLLGAAGATGIGQALASGQRWLGLAGGAWLAWIGLKSLRLSAKATATATAATPATPATRAAAPWHSAFSSSLGLTLTNPVTILFFATTFAGLGLPPGLAGAAWLVVGVFLGSAAWWLLLSSVVARIGHQLGPAALRRIDLASGALLLGFAAWALWRSLH